ncbi:hypothetical protein HB662_25900 [Roseomonas frigidaquae]|uniref:Uncharacterized protein n=1 Tax=Falsiroseomonas frigidaquae TaxID=487318 RepID=A0ABX1F7B1_9PROT|nr:hypothetical protein [Falsiroseomonas frigidaquae]NKE48237.1 hypothetical protein [Falsiroseomonas frigidaquae]
MNDTAPGHGRWDLDYLMPEMPAQGRWRGGPVNHRLRSGNETLIWHPGDGSRVITLQDGVRTLRLEDTDRTLEQVLAAIRPEPNSAGKPRLLLGEISVAGVRGTVALGEEQIRFAGLHRIVIGGYSAYPARGG